MWRAIAFALSLLPLQATAQGAPSSERSAILTIVPERLYDETRAGKTVEERAEEASRALMAENRRIEAELEAEERELTQKRDTLPPDQFRTLADAFDAKAERIRDEQDAKSRRIARMREQDRQLFVQAAIPVLAELMHREGAVAILDRSSVFLSFDLLDVTDRAIRTVDEKLGDGATIFERPAAEPGTP
ncbi:OmpH family outer membrane protein [Falsirhodobacter deserti]|uniref:OmpH family outer membrane protein n=1 Tax=Falsirhodobacter deserti TaxID=1365611 RepID=UPI000FE2C9E7|nr:OmpH family outer membrane protein [Falsirhodobacter deserti]